MDNSARIFRHEDKVCLRASTGDAIHMTAAEAKKIAKGLLACAKDIYETQADKSAHAPLWVSLKG